MQLRDQATAYGFLPAIIEAEDGPATAVYKPLQDNPVGTTYLKRRP